MNFKRAHELGLDDRDAYWHWSEMEAANGEWKASAESAELGLEKFRNDQGLLFRLGCALHRQGKELIIEGDSAGGDKLCRRAHTFLEQALNIRTSEDRNFTLRGQLHRAIVLNLEAINDGVTLTRQLALWQRELPNDGYFQREYERLREKYPQYLSAH